eukprot:gene3251-3732_t
MATIQDNHEGPFYFESILFFIKEASIANDSDDEFTYEEVPVDDEFSVSDADEDLNTVVKSTKEKEIDEILVQDGSEEATVEVTRMTHSLLRSSSQYSCERPEVVEDFVRNFLVRMGMNRTLDCFQTEWYELREKGLLIEEDTELVPDVYIRNQQLEDSLKALHAETETFKNASKREIITECTTEELSKKRTNSSMILRGKDKPNNDVNRSTLKQHYASYEPTLKTLKQKYEVAMKEKLLTKLERDRAIGQVQGLQSTISQIEVAKPSTIQVSHPPNKRSALYTASQGPVSQPPPPETNSLDSVFPPDKGVNPLLSKNRAPCAHLTRTGGFRLTNTINAHELAVSGLSMHPRKQVLATTSDDKTWKLWSVPGGELIMTGEGHDDWVSDCDFHPSGSKLATASGDSTVKIWDFAKAQCVQTFTDHTHAVWGCNWHSCGDFLATCSMDGTCKVWDLNSLRCRNTLRGHTDSVNSIMFLPFSNTLCTCSADKTISLWDARTALCSQTLYGHVHSLNHVIFNDKGDSLASCDSYGIVKIWDVRTASVMTTLDFGPHPGNRVAFDPSTTVLAVASNDGMVKMYDISGGNVTSLTGHEDAVQAAVFDKHGEFLVSGASDGTIRIWA